MIKNFLIPFLGLCFFTSWSLATPIYKIEIEGNNRVETATIMSYLTFKPGEAFCESQIEETLKNLFSTGLFADVVIEPQQDRLLIKVVENKIINRLALEGNSRLKDEVILEEMGIKPREIYTPAKILEAAQKIREMYRARGRYGDKVEPKIVELEENRVDLIFEIDEGNVTCINKIIFVGNCQISTEKLQSVIMTKETRWYRFFSTDDTYDPHRLTFDKELLRRYYREQGYADFKVESVVAELDPYTQEFYVTYTVNEGPRYRLGDINVTLQLPKLSPVCAKKDIPLKKGEWFNSKKVEKTIEKLTTFIGEEGFAFVEIEPQFKRNLEAHTLDINFLIKEGPHVYINRIDIIGNNRTDDDVIRREFRLAEGDAYNSIKLKRTEERLENLDFFKKIEIKEKATTAPDKVDIKVEVEDKPTGSLQFAGGYSTVDGPLGSVTLNERNLMGKGYDLYTSALIAKRAKDFHIGFTNPYFLGHPLSAGIDLFHAGRKYSTKTTGWAGYKQRKTGGTLSLGYDLMDRLGQSWSYTLRRDHIGDMRSNASPFLLEQKGNWIVSSVDHGLFYDKRNSNLEPTKGYFVALGNEFAGLGGTVRYLKNSARAGAYFSLDEERKWVLATKISGGIMSGLGKITRVVDRYELGADTLRGFAEGGVGPRDKRTGDALGGLFYYKGTIELSFPLGLPNELGVKGNLFTDIGSVWHSGNSSPFIQGDTPRPRLGMGAGLTWRSPFGLIGIYYAPVVWDKKGIDRKQQFNVTFGSNF